MRRPRTPTAAAILMLSFLSMSTGPETDLKILATGLGAGILVDAVVVRCLLVPAIVALSGNPCGAAGTAELANAYAPRKRILCGTAGAPDSADRTTPLTADGHIVRRSRSSRKAPGDRAGAARRSAHGAWSFTIW